MNTPANDVTVSLLMNYCNSTRRNRDSIFDIHIETKCNYEILSSLCCSALEEKFPQFKLYKFRFKCLAEMFGDRKHKEDVPVDEILLWYSLDKIIITVRLFTYYWYSLLLRLRYLAHDRNISKTQLKLLITHIQI